MYGANNELREELNKSFLLSPMHGANQKPPIFRCLATLLSPMYGANIKI